MPGRGAPCPTAASDRTAADRGTALWRGRVTYGMKAHSQLQSVRTPTADRTKERPTLASRLPVAEDEGQTESKHEQGPAHSDHDAGNARDERRSEEHTAGN